jgi:hypothetical protein
MFREPYDEKLRESEQMSKFSPPINKVGKLLRPSIIPIISQTKSLDFLDIMNSKKVVVCRFPKERLGEEIVQIPGSLIVSMVSISMLKREKRKVRPPCMLVADELHNFIHGGRFGTLLAESRKYGSPLSLPPRECISSRLPKMCFPIARRRSRSTSPVKTQSLLSRIGMRSIRHSLQRWGRKGKDVVEKINRFLASSASLAAVGRRRIGSLS